MFSSFTQPPPGSQPAGSHDAGGWNDHGFRFGARDGHVCLALMLVAVRSSTTMTQILGVRIELDPQAILRQAMQTAATAVGAN